MKKIIYAFITIILLLSISGCYTVAWQPGEELPVKDEVTLNNSSYYNVNDFGVFSYYYNSTWWLNEDYDFLLNNFNTVIEINSIISDDYYFDNNSYINIEPPSQNISRNNKTKVRNTSQPKLRTTSTNNENSNIRNNNGSRNNSKGKGRWKNY